MTVEEWDEIVKWVDDRWPNQWHPEQQVAYYDDLAAFDASDVWTALFAENQKGIDFAPKGSRLIAGANESCRQTALNDRYDSVALPVPVEEPRTYESHLDKWYPGETVSWTEHIRRLHADGYPCQSHLCDIHDKKLLATAKETT